MELFLVWFCAFLALGLLGFICLARRDLGGTIPGLHFWSARMSSCNRDSGGSYVGSCH